MYIVSCLFIYDFSDPITPKKLDSDMKESKSNIVCRGNKYHLRAEKQFSLFVCGKRIPDLVLVLNTLHHTSLAPTLPIQFPPISILIFVLRLLKTFD